MSNINREYIESYIRDITPRHSGYLQDMEDYAYDNDIPIIEPEVSQFMKLIVKLYKPRKILEIGTAIGYSALVMAESLEGNFRITTIERDEKMISLAKKYVSRSPYNNNITILEGDASEILSGLVDNYDFIFLDGAKGQYLQFLNHCKKLLSPHGLIVSDNVLFKGMVASDELLIKRKKTIVKRLREYLKYINEMEGYISSIIPIGDGIALTYREE